MKVPWISKRQIADKADRTLRKYESKISAAMAPPIQVENIIEHHLDLQIGFIDFEKDFGLMDVLGATFVDSRLICVSETLVQDKNEGRICFTYAHEIGHWVLHRKFLKNNVTSERSDLSVFCRTRDAKKPIEWQADYFAACLLMPQDCIKAAWEKAFGPDPLVMYNEKGPIKGPLCIDPCVDNWHLIADIVIQVGQFTNVSKQAMIIRLQDLGMVQNKSNVEIGWTNKCVGELSPV